MKHSYKIIKHIESLTTDSALTDAFDKLEQKVKDAMRGLNGRPVGGLVTINFIKSSPVSPQGIPHMAVFQALETTEKEKKDEK